MYRGTFLFLKKNYNQCQIASRSVSKALVRVLVFCFLSFMLWRLVSKYACFIRSSMISSTWAAGYVCNKERFLCAVIIMTYCHCDVQNIQTRWLLLRAKRSDHVLCWVPCFHFVPTILNIVLSLRRIETTTGCENQDVTHCDSLLLLTDAQS